MFAANLCSFEEPSKFQPRCPLTLAAYWQGLQGSLESNGTVARAQGAPTEFVSESPHISLNNTSASFTGVRQLPHRNSDREAFGEQVGFEKFFEFHPFVSRRETLNLPSQQPSHPTFRNTLEGVGDGLAVLDLRRVVMLGKPQTLNGVE